MITNKLLCVRLAHTHYSPTTSIGQGPWPTVYDKQTKLIIRSLIMLVIKCNDKFTALKRFRLIASVDSNRLPAVCLQINFLQFEPAARE